MASVLKRLESEAWDNDEETPAAAGSGLKADAGKTRKPPAAAPARGKKKSRAKRSPAVVKPASGAPASDAQPPEHNGPEHNSPEHNGPELHGTATSGRLMEALHKDDIRGEKALAIGQGCLSLFVLSLHLMAMLRNDLSTINPWILGTLGFIFLSSVARYLLVRGNQIPLRILIPLSAMDVAVFLTLIWSYQFVYETPAGGVLKSPSFVLLLVLVALRALRFHPRPVIIVGSMAAVGWCVLVGLAVWYDGAAAITHDYKQFLTSYRILLGAEIEKLVSIVALTLCLAVTTYKARKILSRSAHAQDYADALALAQQNLDLARQAKKRAETALDSLSDKDAELREQNLRFNTALAHMSQGLSMFDRNRRLMVFNDRFLEIYGLAPGEVRAGMSFDELAKLRLSYGAYGEQNPKEFLKDRHEFITMGVNATKFQKLHDGRVVALSRRPMADGAWVTTHEDITELQKIQDRMTHMAHHDALTGLPNRVLLHQRIGDALKRAKRGEEFAILYLDLDRFKTVNDTLGHPVGDKLLKVVAQRLQGCVRETDTVARLGGDEFAILQAGARQPGEATTLATRIGQVVREPIEIEGHRLMVDTSIGIAIAPANGENTDQLLKNADIALYGAKSDGRGVCRFFEPAMDAQMKKRRQLELDLRVAFEHGEFELHYQPLFNLRAGSISGFEALLRWRHPERGLISPVDFVPIAEEIGLIVPLGEWVIRTACAEVVKWPGSPKIAVNLSPVQFKSGGLVPTVISALAASGLAPSRLELEITEYILIEDTKTTVNILHQLRGLGVRIAMDDFGTGYSSLSYLRSFPFDKIKIDRSFIKDLGKRDDAAAIIRAVANMAVSLGMDTTAEGVEEQGQMDMIVAEGLTEIQGFLISEPVPAAQAIALITKRTRAPRKSARAR